MATDTRAMLDEWASDWRKRYNAERASGMMDPLREISARYNPTSPRNTMNPGYFYAYGTNAPPQGARGPFNAAAGVDTPVVTNMPRLPFAGGQSPADASGLRYNRPTIANEARDSAGLPYAPGFAPPTFDTGRRFTDAERADISRRFKIYSETGRGSVSRRRIDAPAEEARREREHQRKVELKGAAAAAAGEAGVIREKIKAGAKTTSAEIKAASDERRTRMQTISQENIANLPYERVTKEAEMVNALAGRELNALVEDNKLDRASRETIEQRKNATMLAAQGNKTLVAQLAGIYGAIPDVYKTVGFAGTTLEAANARVTEMLNEADKLVRAAAPPVQAAPVGQPAQPAQPAASPAAATGAENMSADDTDGNGIPQNLEWLIAGIYEREQSPDPVVQAQARKAREGLRGKGVKDEDITKALKAYGALQKAK